MNLRSGVLILSLLVAAASVAAAYDARRVASVSASPCASVKARPDAWVGASVNALVRAARRAYEDEDALSAYEGVLGRISNTLRRCELSSDEGFVAHHREFIAYVEAASLDLRPDHELGFVVPDQQYFAETRRYVEIPDFLATQGFFRSVSRYETLARAKSYLRQLNSQRTPSEQLLFFSYKSRHLGTPDSDESYGRLLVVVPGDAARGVPEKWVQFGVPDPGARSHVRNVSVVSTIARPDGTSDVYFKDFYRTFRRDGSISIAGRWELGYGDDNCAQCHKSGILPIFPVAGSVGAGEQQTVEEVNRRFRGYGSARFENYLDETKFGPGLGSATWADRGARFGEGFRDSSLGRAMTCAACHQRDYMGALNWPMDRVVISSYVKGGMMPRGYELHDTERAELYRKLIQEYFDEDDAHPGILKSWLTGRLRATTEAPTASAAKPESGYPH
ncbi:MAG: hypothetical protein QOJ70_3104 [Acidobacteriota bacterium]|jgi:hypothetical protein|nr:hypothetical protein [Acidobacteriota bacterium]